MMEGMKDIRRTTIDVRSTEDICPNRECGTVALTNDDVLVRFCDDDDTKHHYVFECPKCKAPVTRPLHPKNLNMLVMSGCPVEHWKLPKELFEGHTKDRITPDNILDFHLALESTDKLVRILLGPSQDGEG